MVDSTIGIVIEEKDKAVISVREIVGGGYYYGSHADIGIDMKNLHFSLTLPKDMLRELEEKIRKFLDGVEAEVKDQAESER